MSEFDMPIWTLIPVIALITFTFFGFPINYTTNDWVIGNLLIVGGVGITYFGKYIIKINKGD